MPAGVLGCTSDARLLARQQVAVLHDIIRAKGATKLELLQQMKDFKRGIYQLEWQTRCCDMQVRACSGACVLRRQAGRQAAARPCCCCCTCMCVCAFRPRTWCG